MEKQITSDIQTRLKELEDGHVKLHSMHKDIRERQDIIDIRVEKVETDNLIQKEENREILRGLDRLKTDLIQNSSFTKTGFRDIAIISVFAGIILYILHSVLN